MGRNIETIEIIQAREDGYLDQSRSKFCIFLKVELTIH